MHQAENERLAQVFLRATHEILAELLDEVGTKGEIQSVDQPKAVFEVAVILGLTGDHEGRVVLEFCLDTALIIVSIMNFGEEFLDMDDMATATLTEMGNQVAGRAATIYNDAGGHLQISPPTLMCGMGMRCNDLHPATRMSVSIGAGDVVVNLSTRPKSILTQQTQPWTAMTNVSAIN